MGLGLILRSGLGLMLRSGLGLGSGLGLELELGLAGLGLGLDLYKEGSLCISLSSLGALSWASRERRLQPPWLGVGTQPPWLGVGVQPSWLGVGVEEPGSSRDRGAPTSKRFVCLCSPQRKASLLPLPSGPSLALPLGTSRGGEGGGRGRSLVGTRPVAIASRIRLCSRACTTWS